MSRFSLRHAGRAAILVLVTVLVLAPFVAAQEDDQEEGGQTPKGVDIDNILAEDEEVYADTGYGYEPAGRRDPFVSLLDARDRPAVRQGPRPEGKPGLLIGEIDLTGIFILSDGPVAQVQSSDQDRSYLLRVGDRLYDGDVVSIDSNEVVFKQVVDDPSALKPFREVVKKLNQ